MDEELKGLAEQALVNAFWKDFSALVNRYLEVADGLDTEELEMRIGEHSSVYGRDTSAFATDVPMSIWTGNKNGYTTGHGTIVEALEFPDAIAVTVQGEKVFERRDGEWYWVEEKHD